MDGGGGREAGQVHRNVRRGLVTNLADCFSKSLREPAQEQVQAGCDSTIERRRWKVPGGKQGCAEGDGHFAEGYVF